MLESLAAGLLNRFLGSYVENFDPKQLNVGIWSGDVKLRNLKLRKESLDALNLPIDVLFGFLGVLTLSVPWSNLKNEPVKIVIENVYMICSPRDVVNIDPAEQAERELRSKLQRLARLEAITQSRYVASGGSSKNLSFTQSLLTKIVDNLQVKILNIHVRYEDTKCIFSEKPYTLGATLSELSAISTDSNWKPSFISITQIITHKLMNLDSICVYWNTNCKSILDDDQNVVIAKLKEAIASSNEIPEHQFILRPVSGTGKLTLNKQGSTEEQAHIVAQLFFDEFGVELDDCQYQELLHTICRFHWYQKTLKYKQSRPSFSPMENPKGYFKYIAECVLSETHQRNYRSSWEYIRERRLKRNEYVELWKKKVRLGNVENPQLEAKDEEALLKLHKELDYDDIKFFRALARREFAKDKMKEESSPEPTQKTAQCGGWFSSWWGSSSNTNSSDDDLSITEEQKKELYDAIDFDENQRVLDAIDLPRDRVKMRITSLLNKGALVVKHRSKQYNLCEVIFGQCAAEFLQRPDSFVAKFELREMRIEDGSPNTLYRHILSVSDYQKDRIGSRVSSATEPFFQVFFENNPLDESADTYLNIKLGSMLVFYHTNYLNELLKFFNPPKKHWDIITAIMNAAESTVEGWTTQTRLGLQALLEEHKTLNLVFDASSPTFIVPLNPQEWSSPCAVLDAGEMHIESDLVPKERIREITNLSVQEYNKQPSEQLKRLMFDRFHLYLKDTQFLIGPDIKSTISSLSIRRRDNQFCILDRMELEFIFDVSIFPKALNLPRMKTSGKLPNLNLYLNDFQYKILMQLADKCIPTLSDVEEVGEETPEDYEQFVFLDEFRQQRLSDRDKEVAMLRQTERMLEQMNPAELNQSVFELDLKVDSAQLTLLKCVDGATMKSQKLVQLYGKDLLLEMKTMAKEMHLDLHLKSLDLEDFIEYYNMPEFKKLITSYNVSSDETKDLFQMSYHKTQRIVRYADTLIEVFDHDIDLTMAGLKFVLSPKSILTLINYALNTFTDPTAVLPEDVLRHNEPDTVDAPGKINMKLSMDGITVVLNDDSIQLVSLELSAAELLLFILPESMKASAKLGGLQLTDKISEDLPEDSIFRQLISMNGNEVVELVYETFDPTNNPHDYTSRLDYKTGSMTVNVVEQSLHKIINYFAKFQKMKGLFDRARLAAYDQAGNLDVVNNMKLNVLVYAPVIRFPKFIDPSTGKYDDVTFFLGELFIENTFINGGNGLLNRIKTGIRRGKFTSLFNLENNEIQKLYMMDDLDLHFDIDNDPNAKGSDPVFKVRGYFEPFSSKITELQLQFMFLLSTTLAESLTIDEIKETDDMEFAAINASSVIGPDAQYKASYDVFKDSKVAEVPDPKGILCDVAFDAPSVSLTLFNQTNNTTEVNGLAITDIRLHDFGLRMSLTYDGTLKAEVHIAAFTVEDIRTSKDNKHTMLIPKIDGDSYQFMASLTKNTVDSKETIDIAVTVDSPKVILAMDYLFALKAFFDSAFNVKGPSRLPGNADRKFLVDEAAMNSTKLECDTVSLIQYSINVINSQVILLADPSKVDSEAVVFAVGQLLLSYQNLSSLFINNMGMFLCKMGSSNEDKIRLLDDCSSTLFIDGRGSAKNKLLTEIQGSIGNIVMRLSLTDIRLAISIFNKAMALAKDNGLLRKDSKEEQATLATRYGRFSKDFKEKIKRYAPSIVSSVSDASKHSNHYQPAPEVVLKAENMDISFAGMRLVLIGDVHELPILDFNIKPFTIDAKDWSSNIEAVATIETYINVFNYSRSSWEYLIEAFPITFHATKGGDNDASFLFEIVSNKVAEITLSTRTIALLSNISDSLFTSTDYNFSSRGAEKPYKVFNDTGLELNIWIRDDSMPDNRRQLTTLPNGTTIPWEFEDWRAVRESLDTDNSKNILFVEISNSTYNTIIEVDATEEGEKLHKLYPAVNSVHSRLVTDLKLCENNVKLITIRSSLLIENATYTTLQLKIGPDNKNVCIIDPGEKRSVPVDFIYTSRILVRPVNGTPYRWSSSFIFWDGLLKKGPRALYCESFESESKFHLEAEARCDDHEPLTKVYPHMTIVISSPLIIENLLPFDMNFLLFSRSTRTKNCKLLKKGEKVPIHDISLEDFLLFCVQPEDEGFKWSNEIIINSPRNSEMTPETRIQLKHETGQKVNLRLYYHQIEGMRAKLISVYSPYVIVNKTERDLYIEGDRQCGILQSPTFIKDGKRFSRPKLFSFDKSDSNKNRARIRFKGSAPSIPTSFEAIGQTVDVTMDIPNKDKECNIGIYVTEGFGKYGLTKVVEIQPRYVMRNKLDFDILITESEYSEGVSSLAPGCSMPLYKLKNTVNKQLRIKFLGSDSIWAQPFMIKDIGTTYLKVLRQSTGHMLLRIDIYLDNATLFIEVNDANDKWPFSVRNFSDHEFIFWQRDPKIVEDDDDDLGYNRDYDSRGYTPIYYKVPPKSVMPYAWDYPSARQKKLIIHARNRRREIDLNEIGNLKPMRLPGANKTSPPVIVDFNIVMDNGIQALVITNYKEELSLYKLRNHQSNSSSLSGSNTNEGFEVNDNDNEIKMRVSVAFQGVGISLVNSSRLQELLYVSMKGLEVRYNNSEIYQTLTWKLKWIQIDNQLFGGIYQNILYPTRIPNTTKEINVHPALSGSISKVKDSTHSSLNFKFATVLLQEMTLQLDEDFLFALIDFFKIPGASWQKTIPDILCPDICELSEPRKTHSELDVYFEMLHIQPTLLHLSFVRTERLNADEEGKKAHGTSAVMFFLNVLTMALGNVNNAPIKLSSLMMENVRVSMPALLEVIQAHYGQQFFYQLHKILGSADFLGNPVGLFNTISSGVKDLFYEPYQGYIMNDRPQELGISLAKGGLSFMKKSVFGLSDSFSRLTGSMAKGLSVATRDTAFQDRRRLQQQQRGAVGFAASASSFMNTIGSGISGIALDPYKGASKEGPTGFLKGLGKGIIGLPTKTAIGVLDLASNVSEGIRNTTTMMDGGNIDRVRLPRHIGLEKVIKPYNQREAQGQFWLKTANGGQFLYDQYVGHLVLRREGNVVLVSLSRIIRISLSTREVIHQANFTDVAGIRLSKNGLHVVLRNPMNNQLFFACTDAEERRYLYNIVAVAVTEFNQRYDNEL
ncbi:HEL259Cp [Eremothecium sinecaudum]|uniref:Vacuolar protein sorting-associated protein n=1 Tax=Eremothecium sinecaudum TaxID=45286 RepID=A0A0X8HT44_9SACH|nr:HEL259Cp [Eremothecium sinecaudum]AMD21022.1 HEL259Cp [Eremothecium sinecaudum]